VTRHQYGISALGTQTSFCEGSSGDPAKRRLFSQANSVETYQRAWGMVEVQQGVFGLIVCAFLRCYELPKLIFRKTRLRVQVFSLWRRQHFWILLIKAAGDKLLMNKFIRQNVGGGLTFKNVKSWAFGSWFRWNLSESLGNGGSATRLFWFDRLRFFVMLWAPKVKIS